MAPAVTIWACRRPRPQRLSVDVTVILGRVTANIESAAVRALCEKTLATNWREGQRAVDGVPYGYTRPSPGHYPFQWYWDSCFAAVVWRHFDAARARTELESLLSAATDDGFIGHTIFWDTKLNERQRLTYNVINAHDTMTATIQPPLLAWAWRIAVGDPREVEPIAKHHAGWRIIATSLATGCCGSCSPTSPGWTLHHSSMPSGGLILTACQGSRGWYIAIVSTATTCGNRGSGRAGLLRGDDQRPVVPLAPVDGAASVTKLSSSAVTTRRSGCFAHRKPRHQTRADLDLGIAVAARTPGPAGGDWPTAGRGAPPRRFALLAACCRCLLSPRQTQASQDASRRSESDGTGAAPHG